MQAGTSRRKQLFFVEKVKYKLLFSSRHMTELVAVLSTGKGSWGHVGRLMKDETWDNIFLITNEFGKENFNAEKNFETLIVDSNKGLEELKMDMKAQLKDKIKGTEVALNLASGTGKEHMALLSALLSLGVGVRFVAVTKEGIKEV